MKRSRCWLPSDCSVLLRQNSIQSQSVRKASLSVNCIGGVILKGVASKIMGLWPRTAIQAGSLLSERERDSENLKPYVLMFRSEIGMSSTAFRCCHRRQVLQFL